MSRQFVISVMSKDRPGIIADITGVILSQGGDLADLNQSVLGGYFTMLLISEFDDEVTPEDIYAGFSHIDSETKIEASIMEMDVNLEIQRTHLPMETFIVTTQAKNRKGLVNVMGRFFYDNNINILDLVTTREAEKYTMIFQVDLTSLASMEVFRQELEELGSKEEITVVLQHNDIFMVTNEVGTQLESIQSNKGE